MPDPPRWLRHQQVPRQRRFGAGGHRHWRQRRDSDGDRCDLWRRRTNFHIYRDQLWVLLPFQDFVNPGFEQDGSDQRKVRRAWDFPRAIKERHRNRHASDYRDQTLTQINEGLGFKSSFYGWYAQLPESGTWDGGQLLGSVLKDVKASGAIFQPAVMPNRNNWKGLSPGDNYQAKAIAEVMKKFTDEGVEVWLRFAHEVNWYQSDGTYSGGVDEFKQGWAAVAAAVADNNLVKMFFTPNIAASLDNYVRYFPDDLSTVQYIGIDYYPKRSSESFVDHIKPFYDKYCTDGSIKFAMGETGTMWKATIEEKLAWMEQMTSGETAEALPNYVGTAWFNYDKEQAFKLWKKGSDKDNTVSKKWFATDTSAEGATMGNA